MSLKDDIVKKLETQDEPPPPGMDPVSNYDYRLDAGPPPAPNDTVSVTLVSIPLDKITAFFKRIFGRTNL